MMKNRDLLRFKRGLDAVAQLPASGRFSYAVMKTRRAVVSEIEILFEVLKASEAFEKYDEERLALCRKHAKTGDDGGPLLVDNGDGTSKFILKSQKKFDKEWKALKAEPAHQKAIENRDKQIEAYETLLDEDTEVALHLVSPDSLPDNITSDQVDSISELISENGVA